MMHRYSKVRVRLGLKDKSRPEPAQPTATTAEEEDALFAGLAPAPHSASPEPEGDESTEPAEPA